jgi:6-phosphofructokinase 1
MCADRTRLGILVGGGPAPGINSAISASTIEAINSGLDVIGIRDGFEHLVKGDTKRVTPLAISDIARVHFQGGSLLGSSRVNPTVDPNDLRRTVKALESLGISYLVTIGGDDTAFSAYEVAKAAGGAFRTAHVPKTIDNDLPLPGDTPTFGYETARHVGTQLVLNLMEDSLTTNRWFLAVVMGRKAGHLALGIGKAAGATVTIIPEEFSEPRITLDDISSVLEGAILKRRVMGRQDGMAVIAEGVAEKLDPQELASIPGVEVAYDPHGHIRLGEIPLATILRRQVQRNYAKRGEQIEVVDVTLGYELRCSPPIPFDVDYTRTLGYGAVRFLLSEPADERTLRGGLLCLELGNLSTIPFEDLRDPATGRTRVRLVDTQSEQYELSRKYMTRLERHDLEDPDMRQRLAEAANISPEDLERHFGAGIIPFKF